MHKAHVLGLLFPNRHDTALSGLTAHRALGAVPFGGRYRLIDFVLSNMVNAGIRTVGIATTDHARSLMAHLGSGKAWDMDRKNGGLSFLPTRATGAAYDGRIAVLEEMRSFLTHANEEYVLLSDCHIVGNIDYTPLIAQHIQSGADITIACQDSPPPAAGEPLLVRLNAAGEVTDLVQGSAAQGAWGLGLYLLRRDLLLRLTEEAAGRRQDDFERDILQRRLGSLRLFGYRVPEYAHAIVSPASYFQANMALLDPTVHRRLFLPHRRIYTKVRDCAPALYGLHATVTDSLVADGAVVEGDVHHTVLFRDVRIGRNAHLDHCVVMQGGVVEDGARLYCVLCDKNTRMENAAVLQGTATYPVYIQKNIHL